MKATEHYFSLVLFIFTFYKLVLSFESVYESSCVIIQMYEQCLPLVYKHYYAVQGGSVFWVCRLNLQLRPITWKLLSRTLLFNFLYEGIPTFESVYKIPKCDHSNESYWLVFSSVIGCNLFGEKKLTTALEYWFCPSQEWRGELTWLQSRTALSRRKSHYPPSPHQTTHRWSWNLRSDLDQWILPSWL